MYKAAHTALMAVRNYYELLIVAGLGACCLALYRLYKNAEEPISHPVPPLQHSPRPRLPHPSSSSSSSALLIPQQPAGQQRSREAERTQTQHRGEPGARGTHNPGVPDEQEKKDVEEAIQRSLELAKKEEDLRKIFGCIPPHHSFKIDEAAKQHQLVMLEQLDSGEADDFILQKTALFNVRYIIDELEKYINIDTRLKVLCLEKVECGCHDMIHFNTLAKTLQDCGYNILVEKRQGLVAQGYLTVTLIAQRADIPLPPELTTEDPPPQRRTEEDKKAQPESLPATELPTEELRRRRIRALTGRFLETDQ
jgi:hypothetical protein